MRVFLRLMTLVIATIGACAGCGGANSAQGGGGGTPGPGIQGHHAAARILLKKVSSVCKSRTIPKSHVLLKGDEDEIVWDIKAKDGCLDGDTHLVIKWVDGGKNPITDPTKIPTTCVEINTKDHGNKSKISCKLRSTVELDTKFAYQVYLRIGGTDTVIEDPDVEIIMF